MTKLTDIQLEKLNNLLNEAQVETVVAAVAAEKVLPEHLDEVLNHQEADDAVKTDTLVQGIVIPFNLDKLNQNVKERLDNGEHQVIGVGADEDQPAFAYTIGGIPKINAELLIVANIDLTALGSILNIAIEKMVEAGGFTEDLGDIGSIATTGESLRYRIRRELLSENVGDFLAKVPDFYPEYDLDTPVYVIEMGDANNLLPGEEGYNESFIQYSHLVDSTSLIREVVTSYGATAHNGKTGVLLNTLVENLKEGRHGKAVLVLTEDDADVAQEYIAQYLNGGEVLSKIDFISVNIDTGEESGKSNGEVIRKALSDNTADCGWYIDNIELLNVTPMSVSNLVELISHTSPVWFSHHLTVRYADESEEALMETLKASTPAGVVADERYLVAVDRENLKIRKTLVA
tara:strand:+ start:1789 stop:2997 length:1209 start_codon:yes stop_codon:yes gene_type:complete